MVETLSPVALLVLNGLLGNFCKREEREGLWLVDLFSGRPDKSRSPFPYSTLDPLFRLVLREVNWSLSDIIGFMTEGMFSVLFSSLFCAGFSSSSLLKDNYQDKWIKKWTQIKKILIGYIWDNIMLPIVWYIMTVYRMIYDNSFWGSNYTHFHFAKHNNVFSLQLKYNRYKWMNFQFSLWGLRWKVLRTKVKCVSI